MTAAAWYSGLARESIRTGMPPTASARPVSTSMAASSPSQKKYVPTSRSAPPSVSGIV